MNYDGKSIEEVAQLVHDRAKPEDLDLYFHVVTTVFYGNPQSNGSKLEMKIYDFLDAQYQPQKPSASAAVRHASRTLTVLRLKLHDAQVQKILKTFDLSATALIVRAHTHGYRDVDYVIKSTDRSETTLNGVMGQSPGFKDLIGAFRRLKAQVEKSTINPLSRLHRLLVEDKESVQRQDVSSLTSLNRYVLNSPRSNWMPITGQAYSNGFATSSSPYHKDRAKVTRR